MDEICLSISGEMLLNGDKFYKSIESECMPMPDGTIKYFFHNLVNIRRMVETHKGSLEVVVKEQFALNIKLP